MVIPLTPHQNYLRKIGTPTPPSSRAWRPFKASTQSMDVPLFSKVKVAGMIKTFVVLVVLVILFLLHLHLQSSPSSSSSSSSSPAPLTLFVGSNSGLFPWNPWQPTRHNSGSQKTSSSRWSTLTVAQKSDRTGKKNWNPPYYIYQIKTWWCRQWWVATFSKNPSTPPNMFFSPCKDIYALIHAPYAS